MIPLVIQAALETGPPIRIMGTDYETNDGTAVRDYIHVEDLAQAHIRALEHLKRGGDSLAANLGMGRGYSVREVIAAVERASGRRVPKLEVDRRLGDPPFLVADTRFAQSALNWTARYANLDEVVGTAWQWHASRALVASAGR